MVYFCSAAYSVSLQVLHREKNFTFRPWHIQQVISYVFEDLNDEPRGDHREENETKNARFRPELLWCHWGNVLTLQ